MGTPPEDVKRRIDIYRAAIARCRQPLAAVVNNTAAAFTMVNCAPTQEASYRVSEESFVWYVRKSATLVGSVAAWLEEMKS